MRIKVVCGEHIYLDERRDEFGTLLLEMYGFILLGAGIVGTPYIYSEFGREITIVFAGLISIASIVSIIYSITKNGVYYDVWISNEHRYVAKTGSDSDKTNIAEAVTELSGIINSRILLARELQKNLVSERTTENGV